MSFVNTEAILYINEDYIFNNVDQYPWPDDKILEASYRIYYRMRRSNIKEIKVTKRLINEHSV